MVLLLIRSQARAEDEMVFKAKQQMKMAYDNADEALQYVLRGADEHPNRIDMCSEKPLSTINTRGLFQTAPRGAISQQGIQFDQKGGAFGGAQQPATNGTFGQPSAFGAPIPSPFGQPAFGQPAASTPNPLAQPAFGQPSFGQPAFGQSSSGQPAFGQPANPQAAFGQPSAPQPAFGQSSASQSAFGQPSFGQPAAPSGQFGTQTQGLFRPLPPAANPNPFGSVPKPNANAFGQSAVQPQFGQPRSSVDGSMSPAQTSQPNPFGTQPSQQAFQQQQLNPFEGGQQQASPFGANQQPTQPNPFQAFNPNAAPSQGFQPNGAAQNNSQATLEVQHPAINTYASVGPDGRINMFKGKRVEWRDGVPGIVRDGLWEKIWFPQAAPSRDPAANMPDEAYDEATKAAYLHFRQTGGFQNDTMPLLPPKMEWCKYDF
jgi:nucleoporin NUP42